MFPFVWAFLWDRDIHLHNEPLVTYILIFLLWPLSTCLVSKTFSYLNHNSFVNYFIRRTIFKCSLCKWHSAKYKNKNLEILIHSVAIRSVKLESHNAMFENQHLLEIKPFLQVTFLPHSTILVWGAGHCFGGKSWGLKWEGNQSLDFTNSKKLVLNVYVLIGTDLYIHT